MAPRVGTEGHSLVAHLQDLVPSQWLYLVVGAGTLLAKALDDFGVLLDQSDGEKERGGNPVRIEDRKCIVVVIGITIVEGHRHDWPISLVREACMFEHLGEGHESAIVLEPCDLLFEEFWSCRGEVLRR